MYYLDPTREAFDAFKDLPRDQPINMLNLIRYRDKAEYDGAAPDGVISGQDAYNMYGQTSGPIFARVGGTILWRGLPKLMLIGPTDKPWDLMFVARYPHAGAFMEMVTDEDYKKAVKHRQAGVLDSRLIRCAEVGGGETFG